MNKNFTEREKNIFVLMVFCIFLFIVYRVVIAPINEKNAFLDEELDTKINIFNKNLKIINEENNLNEEYEIFYEAFSQKKANEKVMAEILSDIENVASSLNLNIADLKPNIVKKEGIFNQFSISLTINSNFIDIIHFVSVLQSKPYFLNVEEIRLNKKLNQDMFLIKTELVLGKRLIQ